MSSLIERVKALPDRVLAQFAIAKNLSGDLSKWSDDQLSAALLYAKSPSPTTQSPTMPKSTTRYLVSYPEATPTDVTAHVFTNLEARKSFAAEIKKNPGQVVVFADDAASLSDVPTSALLVLFNKTRSVAAAKFANRLIGQESAFKALAGVATEINAAAPKAPKAPKEPKAAKAPAGPRLIAYEPKLKAEIKQVRPGTKIATLIDLLAQEKGATLQDLERALSAVGKTVNPRQWMGYDLNTVVGYGARSIVEGDTLRCFLVLPKGMTAPLPHKEPVKKEAPAPKAPAAPKAPKAEAPAAPKAPKAEAPALKLEKTANGGKALKVSPKAKAQAKLAAKKA